MPPDKAIDVAPLQLHARLVLPAVVLALEEGIEKALLQLDAVIGIEMGPMLEAVRFQPLVLRSRTHEALEIAARVQTLPAPVRRRQKRHADLVPDRRARLVIVVVERMRADLVAKIAAIGVELAVRKRFVAAHGLARDAALRTARAEAVLNGLNLHVVPVG